MHGCRFFLPPIILYAGLSVRKKAFFQFLPTSATLGILGTYIAFAVIALLLYAMSRPLGITLAVRLPLPYALQLACGAAPKRFAQAPASHGHRLLTESASLAWWYIQQEVKQTVMVDAS